MKTLINLHIKNALCPKYRAEAWIFYPISLHFLPLLNWSCSLNLIKSHGLFWTNLALIDRFTQSRKIISTSCCRNWAQSVNISQSLGYYRNDIQNKFLGMGNYKYWHVQTQATGPLKFFGVACSRLLVCLQSCVNQVIPVIDQSGLVTEIHPLYIWSFRVTTKYFSFMVLLPWWLPCEQNLLILPLRSEE